MLRYHTYIIVILPHIVSQPHLHSLSHKRCRQSTLLSAGETSTSFGVIQIIVPVPLEHPRLPARCQPIGQGELGVDLHAARACGLSMALRLDLLRLLQQSPSLRAVRRSGLLALPSSRAVPPRLTLPGLPFRPATARASTPPAAAAGCHNPQTAGPSCAGPSRYLGGVPDSSVDLASRSSAEDSPAASLTIRSSTAAPPNPRPWWVRFLTNRGPGSAVAADLRDRAHGACRFFQTGRRQTPLSQLAS